jgi:hypothetical protein
MKKIMALEVIVKGRKRDPLRTTPVDPSQWRVVEVYP